ncbi:MAG TPA: calcium-binding protein, partial [Methyloceanibacter sp.]|nr:calcium-binding protein [Methyloceanibacter sp.]
LTGGDGNDIFVFDTIAEGGDTISDFVSGADKLHFSATGFPGTSGNPPDFASGANPTASTGDAWFLYDTDDGKLYFDADGNGGGGAVHIVTLSGAPTLVQTDLFLF